MITHSDKALKTITEMNTSPEDWALTPIVWKVVKMLRDVQEECPTCRGRGKATTYPDGRLFGYEADVRKALKKKKNEYIGHFEMLKFREKHGVDYLRCPTCPEKKSKSSLVDRGTGIVVVKKEIDVLVGHPVWAKKTQFDSRFSNKKNYRNSTTASGKPVKHVCELCSKSITGRWSNLVPVNARGSDGAVHGMWVGEDCARKFLGVELVLDQSQLDGVSKSELKQRFVIKMGK